MKKIIMTLVATVMVALSANAQVYLGGNFGIGSTKINGGDAVTTYAVLPEIGYNFNKKWALGTTVGFGKGNPVNIEGNSSNYFTVDPYVRFTPIHSKYVNVFVDGGFGYTHYNHAGEVLGHSVNEWQVGLKPGVSVNLSEKLSFVAHAGFLGWKTSKGDYDGAKSSNAWGVDLDGNNLTFGLLYNF
jgi:hypothetical protein